MPYRVLIADPDESLVESYRDHLERQGFIVETATNTLDCLEKLQDFAPEVLVLEPCIPGGGGDSILAKMRDDANIPHVPVIVLTYGRDQGVLYRLARFDIQDYRIKPLSPKRLEERIRAIAHQAMQVTSLHVERAAEEQ